MEKRIFGYIRVSTKDQKTDRQNVAMAEANVPEKNVFTDKLSGRNFERPQYKKMLRKLKKGDTLFVKSIDRLGRNYEEIIEQWRIITKEKCVDIVIIDFPLLDTRKKDKDLTGTFVADLVLQILSYVAQTERENIKQRQKEGIAAAKNKGIKFGRPKKVIPKEFRKYYRQWKKGTISGRQAGIMLGVNHNTFFMWARNCDAKKGNAQMK